MTISMEEALGLEPPKPAAVTQEIDKELEFSEFELKVLARRKTVFDRRLRGESLQEIYDFLRQNGTPACKKTIWNDLHSEQATGLAEELIRQQYRDVALLRGLAINEKDLKALAAAINARGLIIKYLMPKSEQNLKVAVNVSQTTSTTTTAVSELLAEYERIVKRIQVENISKVCSQE
jgi:hypothetical protein